MKFMRIFLAVTLFQNAALASGWSRTDRNAIIIGSAANRVEGDVKRIERTVKDDIIERRDRFQKSLLEMELELKDAYETTLYWASQSPDAHRFINRVAINVSRSAREKIESALEKLKQMEDQSQFQDHLELMSEKLAHEDIASIQTHYSDWLKAEIDSDGKRIVASLKSVK
ncbi:MAG: hypothetical protein KDD25_06360 [Bdellovibrionales bacterium]|nr:hypothetical protein [Bdellovibrionales bacterium]